jgi:hypothetical protein
VRWKDWIGFGVEVGVGAGTRNRTRDLLITSQLLYQLSYTGNTSYYTAGYY